MAIPVLSVYAATRGETDDSQADLHQLELEEMIAAPALWCPNPAETKGLRVRGSSMSPQICDGDIVAVDSSPLDPRELNGKIVVAQHSRHGLSLGRFTMVGGMQLLESENREHEPIILSKDRKWRTIGKVLWWVRKAP